jgi:hypothetical protein
MNYCCPIHHCYANTISCRIFFLIENIQRWRITSGDYCRLSFFLSHHHNKAFLLLLKNEIHLSRKHRKKELCFYLATKRCYATSAYQSDRKMWKEMFHFLQSNFFADCLYQNAKQSEKLRRRLASNIIFSRIWENEREIRSCRLHEVRFLLLLTPLSMRCLIRIRI